MERVSLPLSAFKLDALAENDYALCDRLARDAELIVREHRGATFWLPRDETQLCLIEAFALQVGMYHEASLGLRRLSGVEWWVQRRVSESILTHYDKDEVAWEVARNMHQPTVSTATYVKSGFSAPLVVFSANFSALAAPFNAKHVAFDGSLLHGVPAELAPFFSSKAEHIGASSPRLSILVNLWHDHTPHCVSKLQQLPACEAGSCPLLRPRPLPVIRVAGQDRKAGFCIADAAGPELTPCLPLATRRQRALKASQREAAISGLLVFEYGPPLLARPP